MIRNLKNNIKLKIKKYGWRFAIWIFVFYLIKGLLWLIIPWFVMKYFSN
tara:strand:- start:633 stop:779 length:147 start_codon:yes stop_codon:yes gene_type:complete